MKNTQYEKLSLSGNWQLAWKDTGTGSIEWAMDMYQSAQTIDCMVPGDVHVALVDKGIIEEPLNDLHSLDCKWTEEKEFWYVTTFVVEDGFIKDKVELEFEGLDLTSDIWLNGAYIGSHNNAFVEIAFDVTKNLKPGENTLVVRIDDGVNAVKDKPVDFTEASWNNEQPFRAWMRKPQFVYGWDWTVWLAACGIWRNVSLHSYEKGLLRNVAVQTCMDTAKISEAQDVELAITSELEILEPGEYELKVSLGTDTRFDVAKVLRIQNCKLALEVGKHVETIQVPVADPKLWWPNGSGLPYLYEVTVSLVRDNEVIQEKVFRHGIRTVSIAQPVLDEKSKGFTFVINDIPIFAKGANHVPADCLIGRITDEKSRRLVYDAAEANMNMIRVWGGGIYESEAFMEACDEYGIMVWHDFMFACGYYPDFDKAYYEEVEKEATKAIRRLRNHSSLIGWSGNNEIQEMYQSAKNSGKEFPWYGGRFYEELLPRLVKELCPDRIYRESSPYGGAEPAGCEEGDQHIWHFTHRPQWEHYMDLWRFPEMDYKFLSEFGIIGAMNYEAAQKCIRGEALQIGSKEWIHHTNSCGEYKLLDAVLRNYFTISDDISVKEYILKSQVIQAELMAHVYDELRSRKFRCSGILLWTLSDSYGIHNWSVIDYYLGKRPIYYYLKRSMMPVNVFIKGYDVQNFDGMKQYQQYFKGQVEPFEFILENDALVEKNITMEYCVLTTKGERLLEGSVSVWMEANSIKEALRLELREVCNQGMPEEMVLYVWLKEENKIINEKHYFFAPYGKLQLQEANIYYSLRQITEEKYELHLETDSYVWMLHLYDVDGVAYSDNDFDLVNGHEKVIVLTGRELEKFVPNSSSLNPKINMVYKI